MTKELWGLLGLYLAAVNLAAFGLMGVDKGRALALIATLYGIPLEQCAAVGDSDNDLAMLRAVGCPVAMGNASEEVKGTARMVTDTNDRDGVAKAIWKLI